MKNFYNTDIETIKESLKEFFSAQDEFSDYNFDGAAITELMNLLAFTIQYQYLYLNFNSSEWFPATAELKDNIYKIANTLNYIPKRKVSANISIALERTSAVSIIIPKYSEWNLGALTLVNLDDISINDDLVHNVLLYEGTPEEETFISDGTDFQTYELVEREDIENDNFLVYVDPTDGAGGWTPSTIAWENINKEPVEIGGNGFYIHYFEKMNIKFDSGDRFEKPQEDDKIRVVYIKTTGLEANGASGTITITDPDAINADQMTITPSGSLANGSDEETIDSIKLNAPQFYTTQNRAVTEKDYNILFRLYSYYDSFHSGIVWGGEKEIIDADNDIQESTAINKKDLGHIYFSAIKSDLDYLSTVEKDAIETYFTKKKIITLFFKHLDPTFIKIVSTVNVKYQSNVTIDTASIESSINTFLQNNNGFDKVFYLSDLIRFIDALDDIVYTTVSLTSSCLVKNESHKVVRLNGAITASSISGVIDGLTITDDGAGNLVHNSINVGTINYTTGFLTIDGTFTDNVYTLNFEYVDTSNITVEKESFLQHEDIIINSL